MSLTVRRCEQLAAATEPLSDTLDELQEAASAVRDALDEWVDNRDLPASERDDSETLEMQVGEAVQALLDMLAGVGDCAQQLHEHAVSFELIAADPAPPHHQ